MWSNARFPPAPAFHGRSWREVFFSPSDWWHCTSGEVSLQRFSLPVSAPPLPRFRTERERRFQGKNRPVFASLYQRIGRNDGGCGGEFFVPLLRNDLDVHQAILAAGTVCRLGRANRVHPRGVRRSSVHRQIALEDNPGAWSLMSQCKKWCPEWVLFLGENGKYQYNKLCKGFVHPCKQSFRAAVLPALSFLPFQKNRKIRVQNGRRNRLCRLSHVRAV